MSVESFVPIEEAARFLCVPVSWLYEQARLGKVPSWKVGKYRRFKLSELQAALRHEGNGVPDPLVTRKPTQGSSEKDRARFVVQKNC